MSRERLVGYARGVLDMERYASWREGQAERLEEEGETRAVRRRRAPRPWDPEDVLELAADEHEGWAKVAVPAEGEAKPSTVSLANMQRTELAIGSHAGLNRGWASQQILEAFWAWWFETEAKLGYEKARIACLEKVNAEQDELFHQPVAQFRWQDMELASYAWFNDRDEEWLPLKLDSHWIPRDYQTQESVYERVYFHHSGGKAKDGHGAYKNLHGGVRFAWCLFSQLGGNAIQLVNREDVFKKGKPAIDNRRAKGGLVEIVKCVFLNTGYADGRGSFPISIMGLGREGRLFPVLIRDVLIRCRWPIEWDGHRSRGGILVESHGGNGVRLNGDVMIQNATVELTQPDRQLVAVNNADHVTIEDSTFNVTDGARWIDIDRLDFEAFQNVTPCARVEIRNCDGNGIVRLRDKVLCPVADSMKEPIVIENGKRVS